METAIGNANNPSVHRLCEPPLSLSSCLTGCPASLAAAMEDITWINQQTGHQPPYNMQNGGLGIKMVYTGMPSYGAAGVTDEHVTIMIPCDSGALFAHPLKYLQALPPVDQARSASKRRGGAGVLLEQRKSRGRKSDL